MSNFKSQTQENSKLKITHYPSLCKSCYLCLQKCPQGAIQISKKHTGLYGNPAIETNLNKCTGCKTCEKICPECAIKVEIKK